MSAISGLAPDDSKFSFFVGRMRILFIRHPEWRAWFFSLFAWALLVMSLLSTSHEAGHSGSITYCMPMGSVQVGEYSNYEIQSISYKILTTISDGMVPWIIMVVAMMFPLLNEPIRHVAFSVRQKDRDLGILGFLIGYTITWSIVGVLFLLLPLFLDTVVGDRTHFVNCLIKVSGFLLASSLIWHPARPMRMTKCGQTMPIRIQGWNLHWDSLYYGLKMGFACLYMCWVPMAALMLTHHNIILMFVVTVIIIYERYLLPHTSKLPGYAWGLIAFIVFGMEMWA